MYYKFISEHFLLFLPLIINTEIHCLIFILTIPPSLYILIWGEYFLWFRWLLDHTHRFVTAFYLGFPTCLIWKILFFTLDILWVFFSFIYIFLHIFNCHSSTIVSISPMPLPPTLAIPTSHPWSYPPLALSMCPLYMFLDDPAPSSPLCPPPRLWLLSVCSLFQCLWLYFACLFVLLFRFHL